MFMKFLLLFIFTFFSSSSEESAPIPAFQLEGQCSLNLVNATDDSIRIQITNWYLIPWRSQEIDTTLAAHSAAKFNLVSQNNNYYDISINQVKYKLFSHPGSSDEVKVIKTSDTQNVAFSGDLKMINEFLLRKKQHYNSVDA